MTVKVGLAFLACSLAFTGYAVTRRHHFQLVFEMSSAASSKARLSFDAGRGYNEEDSRTAFVWASSPAEFREFTFDLPHRTISRLKFDLPAAEGRVILRNIEIRSSERVLVRIPPEGVEFSTLPQPGGLSLAFKLAEPLHLKRTTLNEQFRLLLTGNAVLLAAAFLVPLFRVPLIRIARRSRQRFERQLRQTNSQFAALARRLSAPGFIRFDSAAIWFYVLCSVFFVTAVSLDLNGSSIGMYSAAYGNGAHVSPWIGSPRAVRSDEWGYETPAILNQALRLDRFAFENSALGNHSIALTGNLPVAHFSTAFRPQFWAFFALPLDYAYSFCWQAKALLVVTGVFTWLLLMTRSTLWSIAGSLWYFFSPNTQWTYSWPSALPEMVGLICLAMVFACYLTIGRSRIALLLSALALAICAIDFALCAYLPHMLPLFWLILAVFAAWCISAYRQILTRDRAAPRVVAAVLAIGLIAAVGWFVYADLHQAIAGVLNTSYPGRRILPAGMMPRWQLSSNFFLWTETEARIPPLSATYVRALVFFGSPRSRFSASRE